MLWLRGKPHGENMDSIKWKEEKAALVKQATERSRKCAATGQTATPKDQRAGHSAEQMDLGEGLNHVV
jgi:hypothetical protein